MPELDFEESIQTLRMKKSMLKLNMLKVPVVLLNSLCCCTKKLWLDFTLKIEVAINNKNNSRSCFFHMRHRKIVLYCKERIIFRITHYLSQQKVRKQLDLHVRQNIVKKNKKNKKKYCHMAVSQ